MSMPENLKHQVILPKNSYLSTLLLEHIHQSAGHCGKKSDTLKASPEDTG